MVGEREILVGKWQFWKNRYYDFMGGFIEDLLYM